MPDPILDKAFRVSNGISLSDQVYIIKLEINPSNGDGFDAPVGSVALFNGSLYRKFDSNLTDWERL